MAQAVKIRIYWMMCIEIDLLYTSFKSIKVSNNDQKKKKECDQKKWNEKENRKIPEKIHKSHSKEWNQQIIKIYM